MGGVSSFGISKTNAHVVLQEAPLETREVDAAHRADPLPVLFALSARSRKALQALAQRYGAWLKSDEGNGASLRDICFTAGARRVHREHRAVLGRFARDELVG